MKHQHLMRRLALGLLLGLLFQFPQVAGVVLGAVGPASLWTVSHPIALGLVVALVWHHRAKRRPATAT